MRTVSPVTTAALISRYVKRFGFSKGLDNAGNQNVLISCENVESLANIKNTSILETSPFSHSQAEVPLLLIRAAVVTDDTVLTR
jgi:hypothetical protein